jgi:hypothetical protein
MEPSKDEDDEANHIGSTLDADGDATMEPVNPNMNSGSEQDDDKESELSESNPVIYLVLVILMNNIITC